jgi:glycosyltransferase involved in cell wall biosynthesis
VHIVPLAYEVLRCEEINDVYEYDRNDSFNILTIGHVNANKRAAQVIRAIGNSSLLNRRSVYRLVGKVQPEIARGLSGLAGGHKVNLIISGEVDDAALASALARADVVSCLRWPSLEAASASAIEAMLYRKATIVTDTGFFKELPESVVKKLDPGNEVASIQVALEYLASNSNSRSELGARAAAWARATFSAENYAFRILEIGKCIGRSDPKVAAVDHFVQLMNSWNASEGLMTLDHAIKPLEIFGVSEDAC